MSIEILDIMAKPAILAWFRAVVFQVTEFGAATARARHPGRVSDGDPFLRRVHARGSVWLDDNYLNNAVAISSHSCSSEPRAGVFPARRYQYPAFASSPSLRCR